MTTLTYTDLTIMAYVGVDDDVIGWSNVTCLPDWEGDFVYIPRHGGAAYSGWRKHDIDPDGDEVLQANIATIGVAGVYTDTGGAAAISFDGAKIYFIADTWNWDKLAVVDTTDLSLIATFGAATNFGTENGSSVKHVALMVPRKDGSSSNLAVAQQIGAAGDQETNDLTENLGGIVYTGYTSEHKHPYGIILGAGGAASGNEFVYACGLPTTNTDPVGVYKIDTSIVRLGEFEPADIDATWTQITSLIGCAYDETDGHILIGVQTTETVTTKNYIAKISTTNGSVLWVCAVNSTSANSWGMSFSRIRNGVFHLIGTSNQCYHIDTSDGSKTTETIANVSASMQMSDDVTNSIIFNGNYSNGGTDVDRVGTYASANSSWTNTWSRLFFETSVAPPPPPDTVVLTYTIGVVIGPSYCSHGQILRPDFGNDAGAANGPAFGKKRRTHQYAANVYRTRGLSVGLDFDRTREMPVKTAGGTPIAAPTLVTGIIDGLIEGQYDFENKIAWKVCRPYPATVLAISGYLSTQDK